MKVSIITVVYNGADHLRACMESVVSQTYSDIEYIVVDGASTDGSQDIVRSFGSAVAKFISEPDKGIYDAMNKGVAMATGDILAFLNADDIYSHRQVVEQVVQTFRATNCDATYGNIVYVKREDAEHVIRYWRTGQYRDGDFLWGWMPPHLSFFAKRELYQKFGAFTLQLRSAADYELMLRFIHKHKIRVSYVDDVLVRMREGGFGNRTLQHRLLANREDRESWKLNGMKPYFFTMWLKPLRKAFQFLPGDKSKYIQRSETIS